MCLFEARACVCVCVCVCVFVCECEGKVNPPSETFQLQPGLFIAVTVYVVCSLVFFWFFFPVFAELSRNQNTFVSTYPSPPYAHIRTHTHTHIQTHKCTSICYAVSLSLVPGSTSAYQMHPLILCGLSCLFAVLSLDDRLSHLGGVCARASVDVWVCVKAGRSYVADFDLLSTVSRLCIVFSPSVFCCVCLSFYACHSHAAETNEPRGCWQDLLGTFFFFYYYFPSSHTSAVAFAKLSI